MTALGEKLYHDAVKARLMPHVPGAREVIVACLFLICTSACGQSVVDSIRFPCPAPLPSGNHCIAYDYSDRLLYLGGTGCESLFVIDDRRGAMIGAVRFDGHVTAVCYNPLVNRVYCGTDSTGHVYVIEPVTDRVLTDLKVDDGIFTFALDTAANRLFGVGGSGTVHVINCATNTLENKVKLPASFGAGVATCYVPPLRRLYVASEPDSVLFVLDCARESLLTAIRPGHQPSALCYNPANGKLYSASRNDTTLKVVDPVTDTVIASLPGPSGAEWLCSNATSNKVYAMGKYLSIYDGRNDSLRTGRYMSDEAYSLLVWDSRHNVVYMTCSTWGMGGIAVIDGVTDSLYWGLLPYAEVGDAALYSPEADRLYCVWGGLSALQASTRRMRWFVPNEYEYDGPWEICADTVHGKLYRGYWPTGVSVVDLSRRAVTANLAPGLLDDEPVSGCVNPFLNKNYILMDDGELLVIDAVADTVITSIRLDSTLRWSLSACAARAGRVLCTAQDIDICVLIDCATDSVVDTVRLDHPARIIQAGLDGMTFVVATAGYVYVVDAGTGTILNTLATGPEPSALCCAADLQKLYCADSADGLYVFSAMSDSLLRRIDLKGKPHGFCFDAADSKLYVACTQDDAVWVVDCAADTVTACIEVATSSRPSPLAYSDFANRVYFVSGDSLGAIDCSADTVAAWVAHKWYNPSPPHVFPALRLVSVTSEDRFISLFSDPPARLAVMSAAQRREPTVIRGLLYVTGFGAGRLFDLSGRRVLDLLPGPNDLSGLPPGIYFARGHGKTQMRRVIILP